MKIAVKRVYCPNCHRLVTGLEQPVGNDNLRILCARCQKPIYIWTGTTWRYLQESA